MKPTDANRESQIVECDDLQRQLDFATAEYHREKEARRDLQRDNDALHAEVAKLRAALTTMLAVRERQASAYGNKSVGADIVAARDALR